MLSNTGGAADKQRLRDFCGLLSKTEIRLLRCEHFNWQSGKWTLARHMHHFVELLYFLNSSVEISTPEARSGAGDYDIVLYPGGMYHTEKMLGPSHQDILCLWADLGDIRIPGMIRVQDDRNLSVKWLLEHLCAEYAAAVPEPALIQHYARAAAILIARKVFAADTPEDGLALRPLERVIRYMNDHYTEPLTAESLAAAASVSPSYLCRIFKSRFGLSPGGYLRSIRVDAAKAMLEHKSRGIEEIALAVGFSSLKYFSLVFCNETGMTPSQWRHKTAAQSGCGEGS